MYKTRITDLELSKTPLTNDCHNDVMTQLGPLRSQSLFQFVQISDEYFVHLLLQQSPHTVINWIQISLIWGPLLRCDKFCSWKTFTWFCSNEIQETLYQISPESPEFCKRYYEKHFGLIFLDTLYIVHKCETSNALYTLTQSKHKRFQMLSKHNSADSRITQVVLSEA